jgi:hypothetical protein
MKTHLLLLTLILTLAPRIHAADLLANVKTSADLDARIASAADAMTKKVLRDHSAAILAAAAQRPHVERVVAILEKARGTFERTNSTPAALQAALGGPSVLFDTLKGVNLSDSGLGVKAKRETDPFDQAFYEDLSHISGLESLIILHTTAQNGWLAPIAKLPSLKTLRIINQAKLNDEGLAHLAGLRQIESFGYIGTAMTGEPFKDFRGWANVRSASFRGSRMNDAGLTALCEAMPNLQTLILAHGHFTDAAVARVASLKKLTGLEIGSPQATPQCLKHITALPIEYLQLGDGLDASAGITIIKDIKTIKRLTLTNCRATTDDDLRIVAAMKHVENLELGGLALTDGRLALLREFTHLKALRLVPPSRDGFSAETQAAVKKILSTTALKFE